MGNSRAVFCLGPDNVNNVPLVKLQRLTIRGSFYILKYILLKGGGSNMDDFKLKVTIGDAQIELEGNGELVHTIFQELRDNGLGKLTLHYSQNTKNSNFALPTIANENVSCEEEAIVSAEDLNGHLSTLENIVLTGGPNTEAEWLLVYATYCSNQGQALFTREDLKKKYKETNRMTPARSKNFALNLKTLVTDKYIVAVNANDFRLENSGLSRAKAIILGNDKNGGAKKNKSTQKKKSITSYTMIELDLTEDQRTSIKELWNQHTLVSNMDKAVLAAYLIKKEKQIEGFTSDIFFTILRTVGETTSFNLAASIRNAKKDKSYFTSGVNVGEYKLSHIGEDYVAALAKTGDNK